MREAVGKAGFEFGAENRTIAGIVGDLKDSPGDLHAKPGFFFPVAQQKSGRKWWWYCAGKAIP